MKLEVTFLWLAWRVSVSGLSINLSLPLKFFKEVIIWLEWRERNESYPCDWMELSFPNRVNRTFRDHFRCGDFVHRVSLVYNISHPDHDLSKYPNLLPNQMRLHFIPLTFWSHWKIHQAPPKVRPTLKQRNQQNHTLTWTSPPPESVLVFPFSNLLWFL